MGRRCSAASYAYLPWISSSREAQSHECRIQDGSTLATLVEACMYCGRSLARVGLDFRGHLQCSIERAAHGLFHHHVVRAVALFTAAVDSHRWVQLPVARHAMSTAAKSGSVSTTEAIAEATAPLMAHPPLAVLANAVRFS
jgi:conserved oligomeric Golgi complex subunit 8